MVEYTEALPGDGWYAIAKRLGGSQADQAVKDRNAGYLAAANGRKDVSGALYPGQIVWYNPDRLERATTPPPPPEPRTMFVGACPASPGGFSATAAQTVVTRFGNGSAVRAFGVALTSTGPRPAGAGHVHLSWDHRDDYSARPTVAEYRAAAANLKAGDAWERQHESDAKMRRGLVTIAAATDALVYSADAMKQARPDLLTVCTFTGWLFSPNRTAPGKTERDKWGPAARAHDVLGVDLDGVHGWPYPDYLPHIPNILAFLDGHDIESFAVPELGAPLSSNDPNATVRLDWWKRMHDALAATGRCLWIDAYVYESTPGNDMRPNEVTQWRALAAT